MTPGTTPGTVTGTVALDAGAPLVCVAFDGVICPRTPPRHDPMPDPPIPGALEAIGELMTIGPVAVHTFRDPLTVVRWWHLHAAIPAVADPEDLPAPEPMTWTCRDTVLITRRVLPAAAYVDDHAVAFTGWRQALTHIKEILA